MLNPNDKWTTTVASIWIQSTSGTPSTFGIYSSVLKSSQSYTQSTLDTVALFKDLGANVGILAGLLYTFSTYQRPQFGGPKLVLFAGAMLCFLGYFLTWSSVVGIIDQPPVALMCLFMFFAGQAMPFLNTADVVTAVHNFRDFSGTAVGIMKAFLGLSGAMLIQVYRTIFSGHPTGFLLMVSILSTINPLLMMWFVRIHDTYSSREKQHLNNISLVVVIIAAYLLIVIILESVITVQLYAHILILVLLVLLLASPVWIALRAQRWSEHDAMARLLVDGDSSCIGADKKGGTGAGHHIGGYRHLPNQADEDGSSESEQNLNLLQAMRTLNFWLLFLATACAIGSGLAVLNNITQIGESLGYTTTETSTLVSLWGIWNSLGRFGAGYLSDYILHKKALARPLFMAVSLATMSIGHVVIASGLPGALYAGSIIVGVCYGSQLSLMPIIASEIFGVVNMGTIFNTITIAGPIGSYLLSVRVVGYIYDKEASGESTCTGVKCFMLSFFIMAGVTLLGSVFAVALFMKTRVFYREVVHKRISQHSARG